MFVCGVSPHAWGQKSAAPRSAQQATACDGASFHLVVDVGHSEKSYGALSARGGTEYEFNLRLATQIVQALLDQGFTKTTLLITTDPKRSGLLQRADRANKMGADLFLSIHHDSVPKKFIETWEYEGEKRTFSDRFPGHSVFISNDNPDRAGSLLFGQLIGRELKARGLQYTPHYVEPFMGNRRRVLVDADAGVYRFDQLVVLRMTRMPAVLLEAGSIIHRDEELKLLAPERRGLITEAVADAVASFCALRSKPNAAIARASKTDTSAARTKRAKQDVSRAAAKPR
ncbi:MAG: N-acetylmuramoyl-L-alanine amidase [Xanthobacteraceae bacterium]|nr:N-acetylmuramoyl-L-alanine amidase [Xanthobacteraceae bacterium]